ncbi:VOC family protein [Oscillospiraceae bacterium CM]|nr:VOC family protein [Oscillospiraceae bacterium CM]
MPKIVPHLWFDTEAREAAAFYTGLFDHSGILSSTLLADTPSGTAELITFQLAGQEFQAIGAGPFFHFNPSVSLMVHCTEASQVDFLWQKLVEGGTVLMEIGTYPFSQRYGWLEDRFGLSWQLMLVEGAPPIQKIVPNLLFSNGSNGMAEEAVQFYTALFDDAAVSAISRYAPGEAHASKAKINYAAFKLCGFMFSAMDNGYDVDYTFNEAFSIIVSCENQAEIDTYWEHLSAVPEAEQCGWLKDRFGLSWQIVPDFLSDVFSKGTPAEQARVTQSFLKMKKLNIAELQKARKGE